jgi:hypothetical protein
LAKFKLVFLIEPNQIILLYQNVTHVFDFAQQEMVAGVICNQTKIRNQIKSFLVKNQLCNLSGIVIFANDVVHEQLVTQADTHIDLASRMHVKSAFNESLNYLAMLEPGLLLQYQILFWQIAVYIEMFTTLNLLHIKNLDNEDVKSLNNANNLDDLHLIAKTNKSDLYVKIMQTLEQINGR